MLFYFLFQFHVIREHCRGKVPKVVAAAHHASVGACAADGEDVAPLAVGQFAAFAPDVARLANGTDYVIQSQSPLNPLFKRAIWIVLSPPVSFNPPDPLFKGAITAYGLHVFHWDSVPNPDAPRGLCVLHVFALANTRTRPVV